MPDALNISKTGIQQGTNKISALTANMANARSIGGKGVVYFMNEMVENSTGSVMGVTGQSLSNISQAGKTVNVDNPLWCASGDNGFFVVEGGFTRVGTWGFSDGTGICMNHHGNALLAYRVNQNGDIVDPNNPTQTISDSNTQTYMTTVNKNNIRLNATPTSNILYGIELPTNATSIGESIHSEASLYDSMGNQHKITLTFTKAEVYTTSSTERAIVVPGTIQSSPTDIKATLNCSNAWYLTITSDVAGDTIGDLYSGTGMLLEYDADGNPLNYNNTTLLTSASAVTVNKTAPNLAINYGNFSAPGNINLNLGDIGENNGIVSRGNVKKIINIQVDGNCDGVYKSLSWTPDGYGIVTFDNNTQQKWFRIPMAYFTNMDGLTFQSNGIFLQSATSGSARYEVPNKNGTSKINISAYEDSNVSGTDTQIDLIDTQRYYMWQIAALRTSKEVLSALDNI